jgi:hypothetical protein
MVPAAPDLLAIEGAGLPAAADAHLAAPADDFFASRAWFDTLLAHARPPGAVPLLASGAGGLLPLIRQGRGLAALTGPYALRYRPLLARGADPHDAGRAIGRVLQGNPPATLDLLDPDAPGLTPFRAGLAAAGLRAMPFDHVGNWHELLVADATWDGYLAARPPALRTTIGRKLKRAARELHFTCVATPGPALEHAATAYETVRAASWKPFEPHPGFDRHLLRAAAAAGVLRLGVLATESQPIAAQYWIIDANGARATVLKLAHAEAAKPHSPGTVLTALMIRALIEEDGVRELDFGRGDDDYKRLWVGTRRQRIGLVVADPRHPLGLLAIARQAVGGLRRRLRGAA